MEKGYRNLGYALLLLIPLAYFGMDKSWFIHFPQFGDQMNGYLRFHTVVVLAWIGLLIVQPMLIRYHQVEWHRRVGKWSYFLFPILILSTWFQVIRISGSDEPINLFFPLADSVLLILFYGLAIYYRRQQPLHMRYMIGTAIVLLGPTMAYIGPHRLGWSANFTQYAQYAITIFLLTGLLRLDQMHGKKYKPYLIIGLSYAVHLLVYSLLFMWT